jgi:predicted MFS family arabinose efflux permease
MAVPSATDVPTDLPTPHHAPADETRLGIAVAALSLAAFASGASMRLNDAMLPRLAGEFHVELGTAAQVTSVFAVSYGLAQLFFGPLGERFGKYRLIAWGCIACAITSTLCALAPTFTTLLWARALSGIAAATIIPMSMAWIGDVYPYERRQPVLARFLIGQIFGLSAGVWMGGLAADHWRWQGPYGLLAVHSLAVAGVLLVLHRRLPAHAKTRRPMDGWSVRRLFGDFAHVMQVRWARVILACVFLEGLLLYGPFAFVASHLNHRFGLSLSAAGSLVMLFGLGGFVFAIASSRLVRHLGEVGLACWGGALLALAWLLVAAAPAWEWAAVGVCCAGIGFYMLHNTLQVNATQMAPAFRGPSVSAFASCFFLGQSSGVALAGALIRPLGTAAIIACAGGGLLGIALVFARLRARRVQ